MGGGEGRVSGTYVLAGCVAPGVCDQSRAEEAGQLLGLANERLVEGRGHE